MKEPTELEKIVLREKIKAAKDLVEGWEVELGERRRIWTWFDIVMVLCLGGIAVTLAGTVVVEMMK